MRQRLALLAVVVVGLATTVGALVPTAHAEGAVAMKTCGAGYVHANLSWGEKCLRAGEFCKVGNSEYLRYGYVCPSSGHLRRR